MWDEDATDKTPPPDQPEPFLTGDPDALHVFVVREGDLPLFLLPGADRPVPVVDSSLADAGSIPPGGMPPAGTPPPAAPPPPARRRLPRGLLIGSLLSLVAGLFGIALLVLSYLGPPAQATVLLVPRTTPVSLTQTVPAAQLAARLFSPITVSRSLTVPASGTGSTPAQAAQGSVTFYNGAFASQTIAAGTQLAGQDGVVIVTVAAAVIPAAKATTPPTYGAATVAAHAEVAGAAGNIAAYAIDQACCAAGVLAKNLFAFAGGQDARTFRVVTQTDIDRAAHQLAPQVQTTVQARLAAAGHAGEQVAPLPCLPHQSATVRAGAIASSVTVTLAATCQGVAYQAASVQALAARWLTAQATQQARMAERIAGFARARVVSVALAQGRATLTIAASGLFVPAWTAQDMQRMATAIAGKTVATATRILLSQPGVQESHLTLTGSDTLPASPRAIHLVVELPTRDAQPHRNAVWVFWYSDHTTHRKGETTMDDRPVYREDEGSLIGWLFVLSTGIAVLTVFVAGLIAAWPRLAHASPVLMALVLAVGLGLSLPLIITAIYRLRHIALMDHLRAQHAREDLEAVKDARRRANEQHDLHTYLTRSRVPADPLGNYPHLLDPTVSSVTLLPPGNPAYAPTRSRDPSPATPPHLDAPRGPLAKPTIEEIVARIPPNSHELCLGRSLQTGDLIMASLDESHLKVIGGTRMGKSCGAAAILDQLRRTHDRDHLLFALLDLENKTSRLFAGDPHLLRVNTGLKIVPIHARTVAEVAEYLTYLHALMEYRYTLSEAALAAEPDVLVYLEEFLYWKRILTQHVSKEMAERALLAFSGLATRGLKAKLHLMPCAQVDYRDEELVEAMAQFIGINIAYSVKPDAARAAGFVSSELLKRNYETRQPGQFVVEMIGGSDLGLAPQFDVKAKLAALDQGNAMPPLPANPLVSGLPSSSTDETSQNRVRNEARNEPDAALQAKVARVMERPGETMKECLFRVWGVYPGDTDAYRQAKQEYLQVQEIIHAMAKRGMGSYQQSEMET